MDLCPGCGGVFLDPSEFDALIARRFEGKPLESMFAVMSAEVDAPLACPSCATSMHQVVYDDIEIDRCPECEGIWIDGGERRAFAQRAEAAAAPPPVELVECGGCGRSAERRLCARRMDAYWCEACVVAGNWPAPEAAMVGVAQMRRDAAMALAKGKVKQAHSRENTKRRKKSAERMRQRFKPWADEGASLEIMARWVNKLFEKFD